MNIIFENINKNNFNQQSTGVGLGNFDGVHIGHSVLIKTLKKECKSRGLSSILYTFNKHPENIIRKMLFTPQITTNKKKIELISEYGIDCIFFGTFDERFSRIEPEEFIKKHLVEQLGMKLAIVGYDYRFGFEGKGNIELLTELGKKYGYDVLVIHPILIDNTVVSSTLIRRYVSHGQFESANKMLGREYSIQGKVVNGRRMGSQIGFPTANILVEKYLIIPRSGVYFTKTKVKGKVYKSITNIGKNPTFRLKYMSVETHILDFSENIYDENVEVFFFKRLRGEKRFAGVDELKAQIKEDTELCKLEDY